MGILILLCVCVYCATKMCCSKEFIKKSVRRSSTFARWRQSQSEAKPIDVKAVNKKRKETELVEYMSGDEKEPGSSEPGAQYGSQLSISVRGVDKTETMETIPGLYRNNSEEPRTQGEAPL